MGASEFTWTARWVFPVVRPPLRNGTVTIAQGRIVAIEPYGRRRADRDLGEAALLPGLVNAHTHLDLAGLRSLGAAPAGHGDFTHWLRRVIAHRRERSAEQVLADIREGLDESLRHGTTLLGDIAAGGRSWDILARAPVRAVVFVEVLGLTAARAAQARAATQEWLACHAATANCRPGLSPHAPYSVHRSLFAQAADWARRWHAPLAVHLAESAAELELLTHRSGSFVPFLQELGVWEPSGLVADVDEVLRLGYQTQPALFIHGNRLPAEAAIPPGSTLVCCPRTSEALGHGLPPLAAFHDRGVRIALGTDSLASSPSLSVLDEVRYLFRRGLHVAPATLLRWATLSGAEALGWQEETGSLEPGKSADLVVVPLPGPPVADPYEWLLGSTQAPACVVIRGAVVWPVATAEGLGEGSSGPMPAAPPPPADLY